MCYSIRSSQVFISIITIMMIIDASTLFTCLRCTFIIFISRISYNIFFIVFLLCRTCALKGTHKRLRSSCVVAFYAVNNRQGMKQLRGIVAQWPNTTVARRMMHNTINHTLQPCGLGVNDSHKDWGVHIHLRHLQGLCHDANQTC